MNRRAALLPTSLPISGSFCPVNLCGRVCRCNDFVHLNINCSFLSLAILLVINVVQLRDHSSSTAAVGVFTIVASSLLLVHQLLLSIAYALLVREGIQEIRKRRMDLDDTRLVFEQMLISKLQRSTENLIVNYNDRISSLRMDMRSICTEMGLMFRGRQSASLSKHTIDSIVLRFDCVWSGMFDLINQPELFARRSALRELMSVRQEASFTLLQGHGDVIRTVSENWNSKTAPQINLNDAGKAFFEIRSQIEVVQSNFAELKDVGERLADNRVARVRIKVRRACRHFHSGFTQDAHSWASTYLCRLRLCCCWYGCISSRHIIVWLSVLISLVYACNYAMDLADDICLDKILKLLLPVILFGNMSFLLSNIEAIEFELQERQELEHLQEAHRRFDECIQQLQGGDVLHRTSNVHFAFAVLELLKWTWGQFKVEWLAAQSGSDLSSFQAVTDHNKQLQNLSEALCVFQSMAPDRIFRLYHQLKNMQVAGQVFSTSWNVFTGDGPCEIAPGSSHPDIARADDTFRDIDAIDDLDSSVFESRVLQIQTCALTHDASIV